MFVIIGIVGVIAAVLGSFAAGGGHLDVLWQPLEVVIIGGSGIFAFIIGNPKQVVLAAGGGFAAIFKGPKYSKDDYMELLTMQYQVFRMAKTKGMLSLEQHVEGVSETLCMVLSPRGWNGSFVEPFRVEDSELVSCGN
ncbi:MAG: chemotaxis protein MotA, partial [Alphaproteobacteria bacterium]